MADIVAVLQSVWQYMLISTLVDHNRQTWTSQSDSIC